MVAVNAKNERRVVELSNNELYGGYVLGKCAILMFLGMSNITGIQISKGLLHLQPGFTSCL